jgi:hypothetical protein
MRIVNKTELLITFDGIKTNKGKLEPLKIKYRPNNRSFVNLVLILVLINKIPKK